MEILNKKARYDYEIFDTYEAGIVLTGTEIKSIRKSSANLKDSYVRIKNNEAFLINMHISSYSEGNRFNHDETRSRKLLLHKKEIKKIESEVTIKGNSIIPLRLYLKKGKAKVEIAVARGKKLYDKRETIKQRDINREIERQIGRY